MAAIRNIPAAEVSNYLSENSSDEEEFCFEGSDEDAAEYEGLKYRYNYQSAYQVFNYCECEGTKAPSTTRITVPSAILAHQSRQKLKRHQ